MTDCYYRLNGHLLRTDQVRDLITRQVINVPFDNQTTKLAQGNRVVDDLGEGEGRFTIDFVFRGTALGPVNENDFVVGEIESSPWTLEAINPGGLAGEVALWRDEKIVAFATESVEQEPARTFRDWRMRISAVKLGVWRACGGDFTTVERGWFEKDGADLLDQDGNVVSDFTVTIPQQETGFPKARDATTLALTTLTATGTVTETTRDGANRELQEFDLSGFLHPSDPAATGDTGVWELVSSPSKSYLQPVGVAAGEAAGGTGMEETGFAETGF